MIIVCKKTLLTFLSVLIMMASFLSLAKEEDGAQVSILKPLDGEVVNQTFRVKFDIKHFDLAPAGTYKINTGHHHLIIDAELPNLDSPIPSNSNYLHFGKAQEYTDITLLPGKHTLQLLLGDGNHMPHEKPIYSEPIEIEVKP
jgi:hypothetical protein